MGYNTSSGSNQSTSRMTSPAEMQGYYDTVLSNVGRYMPQGQTYIAPKYQGLSNGNYDALQQSLQSGTDAGIDRAWGIRKNDINNEMAAKGLWSSGLPIQQQSREFEQSFAPLYAKSAADAVAQRYQLQQGDNNTQNAFNLTNAQNTDANSWRTADYLAQLWMGGKGQNSQSSGSTSGWGFTL